MAKRTKQTATARDSEPDTGLVLFQPADGGEAVRVRIEGETVWLAPDDNAKLEVSNNGSARERAGL